MENFCIKEKFIIDNRDANGNKNIFEQLIASKVFGFGPIGKEFAKDFDDMTRRGVRTDMGITFFRIWARSIFKLLIKKEFYIKGKA